MTNPYSHAPKVGINSEMAYIGVMVTCPHAFGHKAKNKKTISVFKSIKSIKSHDRPST